MGKLVNNNIRKGTHTMKKIKLAFILGSAAVFILAACRATPDTKTTETESASETAALTEESAAPETDAENTTSDKLEGLTKDEYANLTITADVLERKAILPGSSIPLTINITNNGDKTLIYTQGSGSFETPQALFLDTPKLQAILPKDYLGVATMDMRNGELPPGETLNYTMYIRAIEPIADFTDYTYDKWDKDQIYVAEMEWDEIQKEFSDLKAAAAGTYEGTVYFLYTVQDAENANPVPSATGYAESTFKIGVTE